MQKILIVDIDNCYTDSREWLKQVPQITEDNKGEARSLWDKFHSLSHLAKPNKSIIDLVSTLGFFFPIFFLTSREDRGDNREITEKQIAEFSNGRVLVEGRNKLLMRSDSDYRPTDEVKQDIIRTLLMDCEPVLAIDDELSNCKMFKRHKIPTYKYNIEKDWFEIV